MDESAQKRGGSEIAPPSHLVADRPIGKTPNLDISPPTHPTVPAELVGPVVSEVRLSAGAVARSRGRGLLLDEGNRADGRTSVAEAAQPNGQSVDDEDDPWCKQVKGRSDAGVLTNTFEPSYGLRPRRPGDVLLHQADHCRPETRGRAGYCSFCRGPALFDVINGRGRQYSICWCHLRRSSVWSLQNLVPDVRATRQRLPVDLMSTSASDALSTGSEK